MGQCQGSAEEQSQRLSGGRVRLMEALKGSYLPGHAGLAGMGHLQEQACNQ